jgi:hypothetical protein
MPKIKLNHECHKPGCVGGPGDVIEVTQENAEFLLAHKGAVMVDHAAEAAVSKETVADSEKSGGKRRPKREADSAE